MIKRLGLRRFVTRRQRGERYDIEEERYDDLRDTEGMIDLRDYADLRLRHNEAVAYIDLAPSLLEHDARVRERLEARPDGAPDTFDELAG